VPFDPLGLTDDYKRQSEVRNGRLAMLANLGFWSQVIRSAARVCKAQICLSGGFRSQVIRSAARVCKAQICLSGVFGAR
jgi:Chlorophyll A-B binding protein